MSITDIFLSAIVLLVSWVHTRNWTFIAFNAWLVWLRGSSRGSLVLTFILWLIFWRDINFSLCHLLRSLTHFFFVRFEIEFLVVMIGRLIDWNFFLILPLILRVRMGILFHLTLTLFQRVFYTFVKFSSIYGFPLGQLSYFFRLLTFFN